MTTNSNSSTPAKLHTQSLAADAMPTPLASTRDAPFVIQVDDASTTTTTSNNNASSDAAFAQKLRSKTAVLQCVPETRSLRAESNQSTQSNSYNSNAARGAWNTGFASCLDCRNCRASDTVTLVCCPCIPAAKIHGLLGASFESGMLYFGGLVFAMLIALGLSCSNTSSAVSSATGAPRSYPPGHDDRFVDADADPSTHAPDTSVVPLNAHLYAHVALVLLALFVVGVAFLRTKTRHRFNISGSRAVDCALSLACCWCVLAQSQRHIEKYNRHEFGLDTPVDTLPAYS